MDEVRLVIVAAATGEVGPIQSRAGGDPGQRALKPAHPGKALRCQSNLRAESMDEVFVAEAKRFRDMTDRRGGWIEFDHAQGLPDRSIDYGLLVQTAYQKLLEQAKARLGSARLAQRVPQ